MNTIYRKVSVKERLPKEDNIYLTNLGWNKYRIRKPTDRTEYQLWIHEIDEESGSPLSWWLEETRLPDDEQIHDWVCESKEGILFGERREDFEEGAKWMRSLAVTAKDNVR